MLMVKFEKLDTVVSDSALLLEWNSVVWEGRL